mmetsp:Transcript_21953/g.51354  ORF Transcript_21953/g.51354 Transcript_21953/m.51354 type:complete len:771 (+) Transcript_21953:111-2423(+)
MADAAATVAAEEAAPPPTDAAAEGGEKPEASEAAAPQEEGAAGEDKEKEKEGEAAAASSEEQAAEAVAAEAGGQEDSTEKQAEAPAAEQAPTEQDAEPAAQDESAAEPAKTAEESPAEEAAAPAGEPADGGAAGTEQPAEAEGAAAPDAQAEAPLEETAAPPATSPEEGQEATAQEEQGEAQQAAEQDAGAEKEKEVQGEGSAEPAAATAEAPEAGEAPAAAEDQPAEVEQPSGSQAPADTVNATAADAAGVALDDALEQSDPATLVEGVEGADGAAPSTSPRGEPGFLGVDASEKPVEQLPVEGSVERVEVPDKSIDVRSEAISDVPSSQRDPVETAERLKGAVASVVAEFGSGLTDLPEGELRDALTNWKTKLEYHILELQDIVQSKLPSPLASPALGVNFAAEPERGSTAISQTSVGAASSAEPFEAAPDKEARLAGEMAHVRNIGRQLESHRTGKEMTEVPSAWEDPEDVAREMSDLRRVRRQIRYLFGGMLGTMQEVSPAENTLRVDDLLSDRGDDLGLENSVDGILHGRLPAAPAELGNPPPGIADPRFAQVPPSESPAGPRKHGRPPPAPGSKIPTAPEVPRTSNESPAAGRPRSGHTELSSISSNMSYDSQRGPEKGDDAEARKERKEKRHRRHRHRQVSAEPDRGRAAAPLDWEGKRDDGAPPKQWNWAEEVMKASLDPENQWDFAPAPPEGRRGASSPPAPARGSSSIPAWEKPRAPGARRGDDVALKARERAEEVMRSEREKQRQLLMHDQAAAPRSYR